MKHRKLQWKKSIVTKDSVVLLRELRTARQALYEAEDSHDRFQSELFKVAGEGELQPAHMPEMIRVAKARAAEIAARSAVKALQQAYYACSVSQQSMA
jgi:hypothetical protein